MRKITYFLAIFIFGQYINAYKINAPLCNIPTDDQRFDCYPDDGANEANCIKRGCCWKPTVNLTGFGAPHCFFPFNFPSYKVINSKQNEVIGGASYLITKQIPTFRLNEILNLTVDVYYENESRLRIKIYDQNNPRYEVPLDVGSREVKYEKSENNDYYVNIIDEPFAIKVYRKSTQRLIFDTSIAPLLYADQFIQFSTLLPNDYIYGLGEHRDSFQHLTDWSRYTIWTRDLPPVRHSNLYGAHPFYLSVEDDGNSMGFFLLNSNAMDVILQPYPAITFTLIGGILDFFIYMGPTPNDVIRQHMITVGLPFMPPYFSLGFHLCRWGYENEQKLKLVIERNRAALIPYDTQWSDIDVMSNKKDWTYDTINFPSLPDIVKDLHDHGQYYINIIDPAISNTTGYFPYDDGLANNVFIKYFNSTEPLIGKVWPGNTVYPDFTNPNTTKWWANIASKYHDIIPFDGIWIDMNEPSNFVSGSLHGCTNNKYDRPEYIPKVHGGDLFSRTVCPSAQQYLSNHYNLHNMYGHFEAIASFNALRKINNLKRPFVLSRSTFAGSGHFTAHWSGDNRATWEDLYFSIPSILNFNMYGIPMVGADVCGFVLDTTDELCIRWTQMGAFYPFMRNHNNIAFKDQDPAAFSPEVQNILREALNLRYLFLPYAYTLHYLSHTLGQTIVRPLLFEFPSDPSTHSIDKQFLFGAALLISPVLEAFATHVNAYFPNTTWYDVYTGESINETNTYVKLNAPLEKINVHIRGGYIIPLQYPNVTTTLSRKNPFSLLVALNSDKIKPAFGSLFWDDGESIDTIATNSYNLFQFFAIDGIVQIELDNAHNGYNTSMILESVIIYGAKSTPTKVYLNGKIFSNYNYDYQNHVLKLFTINLDIYQEKTISIKWI